ncbi:PX-associated-domain-containing protein [Hypoxylon sp. FL1150]|nr:PX-associated-domain-containing protein [Hypoxylon sp. FL1150]
MSSATLSPPQLGALLDILVHHETYSEVQNFKDPDAIEKYGYPFDDSNLKKKNKKNGSESPSSASPLLQLLLTRLILPAPGIRDLPSDFWSSKFRALMKRLGEADLSESYDKGTLGSRKRLASAASVIHECITRGLLSGVPDDTLPDLHGKYDIHKAKDLNRAWDDVVQHLVHGDLVDELFDEFTKTASIEKHSPAVEAAVDSAIIYIATFLHHLFVLSAEGPYLLKLLSNVHGLIPYSVVGQTLRVGNAGTMINAMVRLFLAKVSVGAVTNWLGFTQNAADGMNLFQRIISLVLEWDTSDFRKAAESIRRSKDGPSASILAAIDEHLQAPREQHEAARESSKEDQKSIVVAILDAKDKDMASSLTEMQHTQCLEYYSAQLAIRDREKLAEALCRQSPDLTTSMVRDGVSVFEPMIRAVHKNVDLRKHIGSVESFLTDLIATSKPKKQDGGPAQHATTPPSVEDYVALLRRNRQLAYDYLHDFAEGCPELRKTWLGWAKDSLKTFRQVSKHDGVVSAESKNGSYGAGKMDKQLRNLFNELPDEKRGSIQTAIDAHAKYLSALENLSTTRMQSVIDGMDNIEEKKSARGNIRGPGVYITRWHCLLNATAITPRSPRSAPRTGKEVKGLKALGKTEAIANSEAWDPDAMTEQEEKAEPAAPDVSVVIDTLGSQFKNMVAEISSQDVPKSR